MSRTKVLWVLLALAAMSGGCSSETDSGAQGSGLGQDPNQLPTGGTGGFGGMGLTPVGGTGALPPAGGTGGMDGFAGTGALPPVAGTGGIGGAGGTFAPPIAGMSAPLPTAGTGGIGGAGGTGAAGTSGGPASADPVIPTAPGDCPQFTNGTINRGGRSITIVAGAKAAAATAPMVFYWHGTGQTAGEFNFMAAAVRDGVVAEGGVLVSFQGALGTGDLLSGTNIFGAADLDIADDLVACAVRDHNVDPRRIFATGCSAGGLFSTAMASLRSGYMAAAAPNSGGFVFPQMFETSYTPALMTIHGENDMVGVNFKDTSATADMTFKNRGGFVINCNHGGGHCGGAGLAGSIWEFFKAHSYGVEPLPWTSGLPGGFHNSCAIY